MNDLELAEVEPIVARNQMSQADPYYWSSVCVPTDVEVDDSLCWWCLEILCIILTQNRSRGYSPIADLLSVLPIMCSILTAVLH